MLGLQREPISEAKRSKNQRIPLLFNLRAREPLGLAELEANLPAGVFGGRMAVDQHRKLVALNSERDSPWCGGVELEQLIERLLIFLYFADAELDLLQRDGSEPLPSTSINYFSTPPHHAFLTISRDDTAGHVDHRLPRNNNNPRLTASPNCIILPDGDDGFLLCGEVYCV